MRAKLSPGLLPPITNRYSVQKGKTLAATSIENAEIQRYSLLGVPVAVVNMSSSIQRVRSWVERRDRGRMVNFCTVHMLVEGVKNPEFTELLQKADMNCPDGMPLVWYGKRKGYGSVQRVCGPEFLPAFCEATADMNLRHYFYGGAEGVSVKAASELQKRFPGMQIAGAYSPPFRDLTPEEEEELVRTINEARPDLIWVCLGCPKQERWIERFRNRLNVPVLLAVGLAVDVAAGNKRRAPVVMSKAGLEWLFRLVQEPKRLWRRYLVYNSIFLYRLLRQELGNR